MIFLFNYVLIYIYNVFTITFSKKAVGLGNNYAEGRGAIMPNKTKWGGWWAIEKCRMFPNTSILF